VEHAQVLDPLAERTRIREEAVKSGHWPPNIREFITHMQSDIYYPLVELPAPGGKVGPFFEMRTYTYSPGDTPKIKAVWEKALRKLRGHLMPPPGLPQPPQKDAEFVAWLESTLGSLAAQTLLAKAPATR